MDLKPYIYMIRMDLKYSKHMTRMDPKPSLYIVAGIYWYTDMLSASDIGRIEIKNKLKKTKIISFSSALKLKCSKDFRCLKFANVYKN